MSTPAPLLLDTDALDQAAVAIAMATADKAASTYASATHGLIVNKVHAYTDAASAVPEDPAAAKIITLHMGDTASLWARAAWVHEVIAPLIFTRVRAALEHEHGTMGAAAWNKVVERCATAWADEHSWSTMVRAVQNGSGSIPTIGEVANGMMVALDAALKRMHRTWTSVVFRRTPAAAPDSDGTRLRLRSGP